MELEIHEGDYMTDRNTYFEQKGITGTEEVGLNMHLFPVLSNQDGYFHANFWRVSTNRSFDYVCIHCAYHIRPDCTRMYYMSLSIENINNTLKYCLKSVKKSSFVRATIGHRPPQSATQIGSRGFRRVLARAAREVRGPISAMYKPALKPISVVM